MIRLGLEVSRIIPAAACLLLLAACADEGFSVGRRYDFLSNLGSAEVVVKGHTVDPFSLVGPMPPWTEDERLFFPAAPRTTIRFRDVPLGANGVLRLAVGMSPASFKPPDLSAGSEVSFRVVLSSNDSRHTLLERVLNASQLESGRMLEIEVPLPDLDADRGDFLFYSNGSPGTEPLRPVWCSPLLVTDGRPAGPGESSVVYPRIRASLLENPAGHAGSLPESGAGVSLRADYDDESGLFLHAAAGRLLLQTPPARAAFRTRIPSNGRLTFGIAAAGTASRRPADVIFSVNSEGREVFRETLSSSQKGFSRRISISLEAGSEPESLIELCTALSGGSSGGEGGVTAVWIDPVIEEDCRSSRQKASEGMNIVLVVVDALRADHVSCYGGRRETTPNLDRAARKGVVFENAWAQSSWTIPSTASLLTGQYSYTHGLYDVYHWFLVPRITTITSALHRAGLSTAAFVSNHLVSKDNNLAEGFESFHSIPHCTAAQLNRAFLNWIDGHRGERFFAYLHYMEPHMPYAAPGPDLHRFGTPNYEGDPDPNRSDQVMRHLEAHLKEHAEPEDQDESSTGHGAGIECFSEEQLGYVAELQDLYDSEIAYWDERFAILLDELETRGLLDETLFVVTSDHGEEFMEHGQFRHGQGLHSELLRVPLVFLNSGRPPERRNDLAGLVDVAPSVLALAGITAVEEDAGDGLRFAGIDLFGGRTGREFLFAETAHGLRHPGSSMHVARTVFSDEWKGILRMDDGRLELFDRKADALEKEDAASEHPELAARLEGMIEDWVRRCREDAPYNISLFDASALERMRAMGYLK